MYTFREIMFFIGNPKGRLIVTSIVTNLFAKYSKSTSIRGFHTRVCIQDEHKYEHTKMKTKNT